MENNKCQICNNNPAVFLIKDKKDNTEKNICEFCEGPGMILIKPLVEPPTKFSDIRPTDGEITYGRLHPVGKTRKEASCRECSKIIIPGSKAFNQKKEIEGMPFPTQTKVCYDCGTKLNKQGYEIVEKVKK